MNKLLAAILTLAFSISAFAAATPADKKAEKEVPATAEEAKDAVKTEVKAEEKK